MTKQLELKNQAYESNLKSRALSVLLYLIDRSNKDLKCFPAIPTMAKQLHISVSTVKRALKELVEEGFVKKESRFRERNRGQTSNLYTLILFEQEEREEVEKGMEEYEKAEVKEVSFEELREEEQKQTVEEKKGKVKNEQKKAKCISENKEIRCEQDEQERCKNRRGLKQVDWGGGQCGTTLNYQYNSI